MRIRFGMRRLVAAMVVFGSIAAVSVLISPGEVASAHRSAHLTLDSVIRDLGVVSPGEKLSTEYRLTNDGSQPLKISNLTTSCGCAPATIDRTEIPAGQSAMLHLQTTAPVYPGVISRAVFFETNDPEQANVRLDLLARADWPISSAPPTLNAGVISAGSEAKLDLELYGEDLSKIQIESVRPSDDWINVELAGGNERRLRYLVTLRPSKAGRIAGTIVFQTTCADRPSIIVPVQGSVSSCISVEPKVILLGKVSPGEIRRVELQTKPVEAGVSLLGVDVADPTWNVEFDAAETANLATSPSLSIRLRVPHAPGLRRTSLSMLFGEDKNRVLIPLSAFVVPDRDPSEPSVEN